MEKQLTFRYTEKKDVPMILKLIKELARYEKLEDEVVVTGETLEAAADL